MSDLAEQEVTGIFGAPKGLFGHLTAFYVRHRQGSGDLIRPEVVPQQYCEGVWVFPCSYEEVRDLPEAEDFVFKHEFRFAAVEQKIGSGSSGGSIFKKVIDLLEIISDGDVSQAIDIRTALYHENRDKVVGIEQTQLMSILEGDYPQTKMTRGFITEYDRDLITAVMDGPDRSQYLHERVNPRSHDCALHIGHLLMDKLPDEVCQDIIDGVVKVRIGDLLTHLGVPVDSFASNPIDAPDQD